MKKVISILLILVLLCALTACRTDAEESGEPETVPDTAVSEPPASGSDIPAKRPEPPASDTDLPDEEYPASDSDIAE